MNVFPVILSVSIVSDKTSNALLVKIQILEYLKIIVFVNKDISKKKIMTQFAAFAIINVSNALIKKIIAQFVKDKIENHFLLVIVFLIIMTLKTIF
jgi:hypothetical protein